MRRLNTQLLYSLSDLGIFFACEHLTQLQLAAVLGDCRFVAISRAQCLAYLVCSPRLLEARCNSIEDLELVNALCRLAEYANVKKRSSPVQAHIAIRFFSPKPAEELRVTLRVRPEARRLAYAGSRQELRIDASGAILRRPFISVAD